MNGASGNRWSSRPGIVINRYLSPQKIGINAHEQGDGVLVILGW